MRPEMRMHYFKCLLFVCTSFLLLPPVDVAVEVEMLQCLRPVSPGRQFLPLSAGEPGSLQTDQLQPGQGRGQEGVGNLGETASEAAEVDLSQPGGRGEDAVEEVGDLVPGQPGAVEVDPGEAGHGPGQEGGGDVAQVDVGQVQLGETGWPPFLADLTEEVQPLLRGQEEPGEIQPRDVGQSGRLGGDSKQSLEPRHSRADDAEALPKSVWCDAPPPEGGMVGHSVQISRH